LQELKLIFYRIDLNSLGLWASYTS